MSLDSANKQSASTVPEAEDDSYVDPILFEEGAYADQQDYEQTIDALADHINRGVAVHRGREPQESPKSEKIAEVVSLAKLNDVLQHLSSDYKLVFFKYKNTKETTQDGIAKNLKSSVRRMLNHIAKALRILIHNKR